MKIISLAQRCRLIVISNHLTNHGGQTVHDTINFSHRMLLVRIRSPVSIKKTKAP